jgi:hypothetical protein
MTDIIDRDVSALRDWLRDAWVRISDPSITAYERREIRNYMKEAENALRIGLRLIADRGKAKDNAGQSAPNDRPLEFRILSLVIPASEQLH